MSVMEARRRIMLNQPHLVDVQGNPISFNTDMAAKLGQCRVGFSPMQEGSGDPSPQNVRPISGINSCTVWRTGANLFDASTCVFSEGTTIRGEDGTETQSSASHYTTSLTPVFPQTTYTISGTIYTNGYFRIYFLDKNGNWISRSTGYTSYIITFATPANCYYIQFQCTTDINIATAKWRLAIGTSEPSYTPYSGAAYPVTFPSEAGTLYGGYVDLDAGEVVATWKAVDMGTLDWNKSTTAYSPTRFYTQSLTSVIEKPASQSVVPDLYCDRYKIIAQSASWNTEYQMALLTNGSIYVMDSTYPDADSLEEALSGSQLVYPLATPVTYTLTPTIIKSLKGANTIWSDTNGNIDLKYWKH